MCDITIVECKSDRKAFNSTIRPISKKRLAAIAAGTFLPKPRKAIRQVSNKMRKRIHDYRDKCFATWGCKCFLCGGAYFQDRFHHAVIDEIDLHQLAQSANFRLIAGYRLGNQK